MPRKKKTLEKEKCEHPSFIVYSNPGPYMPFLKCTRCPSAWTLRDIQEALALLEGRNAKKQKV